MTDGLFSLLVVVVLLLHDMTLRNDLRRFLVIVMSCFCALCLVFCSDFGLLISIRSLDRSLFSCVWQLIAEVTFD